MKCKDLYLQRITAAKKQVLVYKGQGKTLKKLGDLMPSGLFDSMESERLNREKKAIKRLDGAIERYNRQFEPHYKWEYNGVDVRLIYI